MTGCERILARLEQGPATAAELYATTYTVVHSRIADLRKRGHVITCEHVGGRGATSIVYTLVQSCPEVESTPPRASDDPSLTVLSEPSGQLSLEAA